MKKSHLSC